MFILTQLLSQGPHKNCSKKPLNLFHLWIYELLIFFCFPLTFFNYKLGKVFSLQDNNEFAIWMRAYMLRVKKKKKDVWHHCTKTQSCDLENWRLSVWHQFSLWLLVYSAIFQRTDWWLTHTNSHSFNGLVCLYLAIIWISLKLHYTKSQAIIYNSIAMRHHVWRYVIISQSLPGAEGFSLKSKSLIRGIHTFCIHIASWMSNLESWVNLCKPMLFEPNVILTIRTALK